MNIDYVTGLARRYADGDREDVDLTGIVHNQHHHQPLFASAVLAWWILSERPRLTVRLPEDPAALLPLARSGLLFVLTRDDVRATTHSRSGRQEFVLSSLRSKDQLELAFVDWAAFEGVSPVDGLRAVQDLEKPLRTPPPLALLNRRYTWIDALTASEQHDHTPRAPGMSPERQRLLRLNGDADQVLYELVSNVHRWAFPQSQSASERRAVAVCSVSRGGDDRLHLVVMDNGRGIPDAVSAGQQIRHRGGIDWHAEVVAPAPEPLKTDPAASLLYLLANQAHGDRYLYTKGEGHGLFTSNLKASSQHNGAFQLLSVDDKPVGGRPAVVAYRSDRDSAPSVVRIDLPGASGTLAHAVFPVPGPVSLAERPAGHVDHEAQPLSNTY